MNYPKIVTRIFGGLGNQLFIYAAARRLALDNNAELVIDDVSGFVRDHTYQRSYQLDHFNIPCRKASTYERLEPFSRLRRAVMRKWNQLLPFAKRAYIHQKGLDFDPRLLQVKIQGTVYLEGYWQSENYFKDMEATIRQDLQIKPPTDATNQAMLARIRECTAVAIHVRFFDQTQVHGGNNAAEDYYTSAVEMMESFAPDSYYFVFSDQLEAARARIPLPEDRVTLVSHNQGDENTYADLWLMTQCQHFIIANSTFSWWGAWLNPSMSKIVIAPKHWGATQADVRDLLPQDWVRL